MTRATTHLGKVLGFALATLCALGIPERAAAFCGFYVTGADTSLYANATMTVLMRDGTRTVLSMQNNYQGPPDAFALVIPVPMVLQKEQVKILPKDVFAKVDALGAPRLVEYWETDPCQVARLAPTLSGGAPPPMASAAAAAGSGAVHIEAQFVVGEYEVVILSADNSSALDSWLRDNKYNIPQGAEPVLAPYVASGMKFFVAKVDPSKVTFEGGQAALSPLRFYYDTQDFSLPVRLGLLNSQGSQDLIVNILARNRYEVANYPNTTVPTNIRVQNDVRDDFGSFYEALYSRVLEKQPRAVVTEYSWSAGSCDPCPTPPLGPQEIATLGGDVLESASTGAAGSGAQFVPPGGGFGYGFTLTRLHARYTKDSLGEDLVFKQADPIVGGRGIPDQKGMLDQSVQKQPGGVDNFQGRYVILHPWEKELTCQNPQRGQWGGPQGMGTPPSTMNATNGALKGATPKAGDLANLLAESVPSLAVDAKRPVSPLGSAAGSGGKPAAAGSNGGAAGKRSDVSVAGGVALPRGGTPAADSGTPATPPGTSGTPAPTPPAARKSSCSTASVGSGSAPGWLGVLAGLVLLAGRRKRERR
jgi:MYXO-CTERM domain-containing protein